MWVLAASFTNAYIVSSKVLLVTLMVLKSRVSILWIFFLPEIVSLTPQLIVVGLQIEEEKCDGSDRFLQSILYQQPLETLSPTEWEQLTYISQ